MTKEETKQAYIDALDETVNRIEANVRHIMSSSNKTFEGARFTILSGKGFRETQCPMVWAIVRKRICK